MKLLALIVMLISLGLGTPVFAADKAADKGTQKSAAQIDINTASADQLQTLDGIGDARAKAIIKGRPYTRKDELVDKKIIPEGVYDKIKDRIVAHQVKKK